MYWLHKKKKRKAHKSLTIYSEGLIQCKIKDHVNAKLDLVVMEIWEELVWQLEGNSLPLTCHTLSEKKKN